jgi:ketosteroid isomerase-like protein
MSDPQAWAETLLKLLDRFDADGLAARMAPDGVLISINSDPIVGRNGMRDAVHGVEQGITSISHEVLRAWQADDTVITELRVTYLRHDGRTVVLPCTNIFDLTADGLISRYQIFMDMTPVFA